MSYAGLGQTSAITLVGRDPSRHEAGGAVRVSARWAQRAINAARRYVNPTAPLIAVDGQAGPITIAALQELSRTHAANQPVTNDPPGTRVTSNVIIPVRLETYLYTLVSVPDPSTSSTSRTTTTTPSGGTVVTTTTPSATEPGTVDTVIHDEGSTTGVRGLMARYGVWPWVVGGTALAGLGIWFLLGGGAGGSVRANRRRRISRNSACPHGKSIEDHREDFGYAIRSVHYFNRIGSPDQMREYVAKAEEEAKCFQLSERQQASLEAVRGLVKNSRRRRRSSRRGAAASRRAR